MDPSFCPSMVHHEQYEQPPTCEGPLGNESLQPHDAWQFSWSHYMEELYIFL